MDLTSLSGMVVIRSRGPIMYRDTVSSMLARQPSLCRVSTSSGKSSSFIRQHAGRTRPGCRGSSSREPMPRVTTAAPEPARVW